jgi:hypothetical protein
MKGNPLFAPQAGLKAARFPGIHYGLEVDVTGKGSWVEQGLYPTKGEAEKDGRAIKRKEGMAYRVKATRDVRNGITDRAKRYRAQRNKPPGPKRCNFCRSRKNVGIDHISGNESHGQPENLLYLCKSCNALKAVQQARNRIGVRTRQYNGRRPSFSRYQNAVEVILGLSSGDVGEATDVIAITPPADRVTYAEKLKLGRNPPSFAQYAHGVSIHRRGAKDEGGAIIHATPPGTRSRYARQIAEIKRQRRGVVPF